MIFSRHSLAAGAVAGGILVFIGMQTVNVLWIIPGAREARTRRTGFRNEQSNRRTAR